MNTARSRSGFALVKAQEISVFLMENSREIRRNPMKTQGSSIRAVRRAIAALYTGIDVDFPWCIQRREPGKMGEVS